jgi:hypothetical protein
MGEVVAILVTVPVEGQPVPLESQMTFPFFVLFAPSAVGAPPVMFVGTAVQPLMLLLAVHWLAAQLLLALALSKLATVVAVPSKVLFAKVLCVVPKT